MFAPEALIVLISSHLLEHRGGILVAWKSSIFKGERIFMNEFAISIEFTSLHDDTRWILTTIYGPCTADRKRVFMDWLKNVHMPEEMDWIILGDFNLMRTPENRNKEGGNQQEMFMFNDTLSFLGLNEIELLGRKFTWSNLQPFPLLEKLDWVFTNSSWTITYPNTTVRALSMDPSDHCPCVVSICTSIPRARLFRFENYWLQHEQFPDLVQQCWSAPILQQDAAKLIIEKFKLTRQKLRQWQTSLPSLKTTISNIKLVIQLLEVLGDYRDLTLQEWNFKSLLHERILVLLQQQKTYWKQRGIIKWATLGDAGTSFFHANATLRHRKKLIAQLSISEDVVITSHRDKEQVLWEDFKIRLGIF